MYFLKKIKFVCFSDAKAIPAAILRNCGVEGQFYDQCGVCDGTGSTCAQK